MMAISSLWNDNLVQHLSVGEAERVHFNCFPKSGEIMIQGLMVPYHFYLTQYPFLVFNYTIEFFSL